MQWINLAAWIACTEVEGPGKRAAIWVQGCDKRCMGCCNPRYLKIEERQLIAASELSEKVLFAAEQHKLEGISLLGGEPFLQAQGLAEIALAAQTSHLSVMVFSGYTYAELLKNNFPGTSELLANTDVLVDGAYEINNKDIKRQWVGSRNQNFKYLGNFYNASIESPNNVQRKMEWRITKGGQIRVNGWPEELSRW
jgi:anaerobic ribonucleoside-triphosphate reductase activating protein